MKPTVKKLIKESKKLYSDSLGIKLSSGKEKELFKWFMAAMLFGKPIREETAMKTFKVLERKGFITPEKIVKAGWARILPCMGEGGYTHYDGITTTKLIEVSKQLLRSYKTLNNLHKAAKNARDLEEKLEAFYGVGPTTVNIFLRELRHVWKKAEPEPNKVVKKAAKKLGIDLKKFNKHSKKFVELEAALYRIGKKKFKFK